MSAIATRGNKPSNVLVYEQFPEYGHCRALDTVTVEAGMDIGAAVVLDTGKYKWIEAADVATLAADVRVVIDLNTNDASVGDASLVTIRRGAAGVAAGGLRFKDALSAPQKAVVYAALEAKGIKVLTQI